MARVGGTENDARRSVSVKAMSEYFAHRALGRRPIFVSPSPSLSSLTQLSSIHALLNQFHSLLFIVSY